MSFQFWQRWLVSSLILITLAGLGLALLGGTVLAGVLDPLFHRPFWGDRPLDEATRAYQGWVYGVLGATLAGCTTCQRSTSRFSTVSIFVRSAPHAPRHVIIRDHRRSRPAVCLPTEPVDRLPRHPQRAVTVWGHQLDRPASGGSTQAGKSRAIVWRKVASAVVGAP